ncbi:MAG TPA: hypothetical protein DD982_00070 [Thalassospira sp.]|nr:hypothetical protein [Thalassospira sp.]MBA05668.1 hypothetical protein [Thalassospira sp.]OHZ02046.1 hypothetical protein BC440_13825 [Thalassospira sp. MIT1004]HBN48559.1 hypothetical protein [Thalassospira sp.]HBS20901.1 hypothetical protein [Thalassospira sp.]
MQRVTVARGDGEDIVRAKKKAGQMNARQVYQGGFTSGRRRTLLRALGMPGRAPGKDRNSVREKTLYRDAVVHRCGSKRKIAFLTGNTTVKLLIQPCVNCINLGLRKFFL